MQRLKDDGWRMRNAGSSILQPCSWRYNIGGEPHEMTITLYNTMSRSKQEFVPLEPGKVRMYCCGVTVYNYAHIGNLRTYIFEDVVRRTLRFNGYELLHVQNVTDVG